MKGGCCYHVAVEKLEMLKIGRKFGDRKCLPESRKSFVAHPSAKFFLAVSANRVFQQPQALALKTPWPGSRSVMGIFRQQSSEPQPTPRLSLTSREVLQIRLSLNVSGLEQTARFLPN